MDHDFLGNELIHARRLKQIGIQLLVLGPFLQAVSFERMNFWSYPMTTLLLAIPVPLALIAYGLLLVSDKKNRLEFQEKKPSENKNFFGLELQTVKWIFPLILLNLLVAGIWIYPNVVKEGAFTFFAMKGVYFLGFWLTLIGIALKFLIRFRK